MSKEFELDPESAELESRLRNLKPVPSRLDRDALLYESGWQAAVAEFRVSRDAAENATKKPAVHSWRVATASFAAISAVLAFLLLSPNVRDSSEIVVVPNSVVKVKDRDPEQPRVVETQVAKVPTKTARRFPIRRTALPGRRDPQRWLRETDRIVATSGSSHASETRTIQDWYREIRNENLRTETEGGQL